MALRCLSLPNQLVDEAFGVNPALRMDATRNWPASSETMTVFGNSP